MIMFWSKLFIVLLQTGIYGWLWYGHYKDMILGKILGTRKLGDHSIIWNIYHCIFTGIRGTESRLFKDMGYHVFPDAYDHLC